jgi:uncharacterized protein YegL
MMKRKEAMAKTKKAKLGNGSALVYLVLDKSGSMGAIRNATIDGCNLFLRETTAADADASFWLLLFDTGINKVHKGTRLGDIEPIDAHVYQPGGGTALLDAVGHAIKDVDDLTEKPGKVVFVIMTDGQENASHEYTRESIKQLVKQHEKEQGWQFIFLGANVDAFDEAGQIGMAAPASSSATWVPTAAGTTAAMASSGISTGAYLRGTSGSAGMTQTFYNSTLASMSGTADATTSPVDTTTRPEQKTHKVVRSRGVKKP